MAIGGWVLLLLARLASGEPAPVAVHLEDLQGVAPEDAQALAKELARSIEATTGASTAVDDRLWTAECGRSDRCAAEIRARTGAAELVFVKVYSAATRLRVVAELGGPPEKPALVVHSVQADLSLDQGGWSTALHGFAEILFPNLRKVVGGDPIPIQVAGPAAPPSTSIAGTVLGDCALGAGAILGGVAAALRISSNAARDRVEMGLDADPSADMDRSRTDATVSNVLFGAGAVLITAGLVYLLTR